MAYNNQVTLIGNLGAEAEIIETERTTFASIRIATTDSYQDDNGDWQELETIWHEVVAFDPTLISLLKSLKKGARIKVFAKLSYYPVEILWKGKETTRQQASVVAKKVEMAPLAKKSKTEEG